MFKKMSFLIVLALWIGCSPAHGQQKSFFVSPGGSDLNPGTPIAPFRTLTRARDAVRAFKADPTNPAQHIFVQLRQGIYNTSSDLGHTLNHLELSHLDSGMSNEHFVFWCSAPGERALIRGGSRLVNWTPGPNVVNGSRVWTTTVPWVQSLGGAWAPPRDLYLNNMRLTRSRFPNPSHIGDSAVLDNGSFCEILDDVNGDGMMFLVRGSLPAQNLNHPSSYTDTTFLQAVARREWVAFRQRITSLEIIDPVTFRIGFASPLGIPTNEYYRVRGSEGRPGDILYLEGAIEFVDAAYEWYLQSSTGKLWVRLPEAIDPNVDVIIAPRSERLVKVSGATNVQLLELDFGFTNFDIPSPQGPAAPATGWFPRGGGGYSEYAWGVASAEYPFPGAVQFDDCENCWVTRCRVAHTGASGVSVYGGHGNTIEANEIFDVGATGVYLGRRFVGTGAATGIPTMASIRDNYIFNCGIVFHDCVGIKIDWAQTTTVFRNLVDRSPYSGIFAGWGFNLEGGNFELFIAWNRVRNAMTWLLDGGAIHGIGYSSICSIRDNDVLDMHQDPWHHANAVWPNPEWYWGGRRGVMMDLSATAWTIHDNVIRAMHGAAVPFADLNCGSAVNYYPAPNFVEEIAGHYCGGLSMPSNTILDSGLSSSPVYPAAAGVIENAGPHIMFHEFLFYTIDPLVHPY